MRSVPRSLFPSLLATTAILVLSVTCGGGDAGGPSGISSALPARPAPEFELKDLDGNTVKLADSAGQVRLIDFWATWCAPCREEIPALNELQASYGPQGLQVIGIAVDEEGVSVVRPFVEKNRMSYTNLLGDEQVIKAYGVVGYPAAYLLDREGKIVATFFGGTPKRIFERKVREALGLGAAS